MDEDSWEEEASLVPLHGGAEVETALIVSTCQFYQILIADSIPSYTVDWRTYMYN